MHLTNNLENLNVLEQIVEQSEAVFFIYEIATKHFRYISPSFRDVWERDRFEYAQYPERLLETIHPDDLKDLTRTWDLTFHRINKNQEFRIMTPQGKTKWLLAKTFNLRNENGTFSLGGFVEDISEAKKHDFTLLKYSSKKNSTLEILTHDLVGPLSIIQQVVDLIRESTRQYGDSEVEKDLVLIQETCARSINLIRDLVNQEFLESEGTGVKKERFDLVQKIGIVVDHYRQAERAIAKSFNFGYTSSPIFAEIDDMKFMQVMNNLIANAIKFTPEGGIINVYLSEENGEVEIAVEDNGIGIPPEFHQVVFNRFTPARRKGLKGEPTVGLGLSIIKSIVEMHQGRIWFQSEVNRGTVFYIRIPQISPV